MRKGFSYANVTATLALFFALSGGALAAKHYLINSTNQIAQGTSCDSPPALPLAPASDAKQAPEPPRWSWFGRRYWD